MTNVLKEDREEILRQTREIQRATVIEFRRRRAPRVQLSFSAAGVEAHIRYPVHLQNAAEIDERVSQARVAGDSHPRSRRLQGGRTVLSHRNLRW